MSAFSTPEQQLTLADCEDLQELRRGRYTAIYTALCSFLGSYIVIKCYDKSTHKRRRLAQREAFMLRYLNTAGVPNITHLWSSYQDHQHHYLLMECCCHGNLLDLLKCRRACSEDWVATAIAAPLLRTLAHMHSLGIWHRDIKLENIFMAADHRPRLGDFELAVWAHEPPARSHVGTVYYMAPEMLALPGRSSSLDGCSSRPCSGEWRFGDREQQRGGGSHNSREQHTGSPSACCDGGAGCGRVSGAAECCKAQFKGDGDGMASVSSKIDVWSLGVCLFELVAGYKPFQGTSYEAIRQAVLSGQRAPLPDHTSPQFRSLMAHMLCPDPARRPSAQQLLQHPWLAEHVQHAGRADSCSSLDDGAGGAHGKRQWPLPKQFSTDDCDKGVLQRQQQQQQQASCGHALPLRQPSAPYGQRCVQQVAAAAAMPSMPPTLQPVQQRVVPTAHARTVLAEMWHQLWCLVGRIGVPAVVSCEGDLLH